MGKIPEEERDPEAVVMDEIMAYMNKASARARVRLMHHIMHKYFPLGDWVPELKAPVRLVPPETPMGPQRPSDTTHES